jgi:hypothetical protein
MQVTLIKVEGILFVGQTEEGRPSLIKNPRMVFANHETGEVSVAKCIANPKEMMVPTAPTFVYTSNDAEFDKFYLDAIVEEGVIITPPVKNIKIVK